MSDRINPNIRYFLPNDPHYFEVDNLALKDLVGNDVALQFQLDQLKSQIGSLTGRSSFGDLKPFTDESSPGKVLVSPGNFVARVNIPADRDNGLRERKSDGVHEHGHKFTKSQPDDPLYGFNSPDEAGGVARTALVRLLENTGVQIPSFTSDDYPDADGGSNPAPSYRLDIVYVEGYPAEDNDTGGSPFVSVIQGGYFMSSPSSVGVDRKEGHRFENDNIEQVGRTLLQKTNSINQSNVIDGKKGNLTGGTEGLRYTTVPLLEDLRNFSYKPNKNHNSEGNFITIPDFENQYSDFDSSKIERWLEVMSIRKGIFCLPVCYVLTPFGYTGNSHIPTENLIDVRPFFRTAEMTLDERQAVATSYRPSVTNRFLTRKDPDYETLRDSWVKGRSTASPGNHEGRLDSLESSKFQEVVLTEADHIVGTVAGSVTTLTIPAGVIPVGEEVYSIMIKTALRISGDRRDTIIEFKNHLGNKQLVCESFIDIDGGSPNIMGTSMSTTLIFPKDKGSAIPSLEFHSSNLGTGHAKVWIYGYTRLVSSDELL